MNVPNNFKIDLEMIYFRFKTDLEMIYCCRSSGSLRNWKSPNLCDLQMRATLLKEKKSNNFSISPFHFKSFEFMFIEVPSLSISQCFGLKHILLI
jgi:hypothetical protein